MIDEMASHTKPSSGRRRLRDLAVVLSAAGPFLVFCGLTPGNSRLLPYAFATAALAVILAQLSLRRKLLDFRVPLTIEDSFGQNSDLAVSQGEIEREKGRLLAPTVLAILAWIVGVVVTKLQMPWLTAVTAAIFVGCGTMLAWSGFFFQKNLDDYARKAALQRKAWP